MKTPIAALIALAILPFAALAHDGPASSVHEMHGPGVAAGSPVAPSKAKRTIAITMDDAMRYEPAQIRVKRGEAVRIVATNRGKLMHEIVIGERADLEAHARRMREHPHMEHHDANMLHVPPGETREMGWRFTRPGEFLYGCLQPGHFEAGMVGRVVVEP
jgi:uncharacterized cupredoxin-like copper-binding protein